MSRPTPFIWPPNDVPPDALGAPKDAAFWRPREPRLLRTRASGDSLDLDLRAPAGWRAWLLDVERAFLGLVRPPWHIRACDAGWQPDPPGSYCHRCASSVGSFETDARGCPACRDGDVPWQRALRLGPYEGLLRDALLEVKFTAWRSLGTTLGRLLGTHALLPALARSEGASERAALVPVPIPMWRRLSRGIDHTLVLARGVSGTTGLPVLPLLARTEGETQVSVPLGRRRTNVRNTMFLTRDPPAGTTLILIDDVRTTGATLREACRALCSAAPRDSSPAPVWTAVVAVTPSGKDRPMPMTRETTSFDG